MIINTNYFTFNTNNKSFTGKIIDVKGISVYFKCGKIHREDGPAITWRDGSYEYRIDGLLHREDGPASKTKRTELWAIQGKTHRQGGPAHITYNRYGIVVCRAWFRDGRLHREDGPAVKAKGQEDYFLNGKQYDREAWKSAVREYKLGEFLEDGQDS